ncbi:NAD-dependent protein deacetylase sirtuin-1-like [Physella acuta]|uniref:NAD-dependent protein deacetylase sirtuin-1-like n=1 Tax=Physella acuta TaxID=109671 RepID=UPI0027DD7C3B|nr:NAD-dependent protein deacetylase sirtuin-1-like [Physella acuta]
MQDTQDFSDINSTVPQQAQEFHSPNFRELDMEESLLVAVESDNAANAQQASQIIGLDIANSQNTDDDRKTSFPDSNTSNSEMKPGNEHQLEARRETEEADNASEISDFSDFSQESWQPVQGPIAWVQEQMRRGQSPRKILEDLVPTGTLIPEGLDPIMLWKIIINIVSEPPKRKKLHGINTLDDVLGLLRTCKKIMVLTGAGVSVSCGIPDFRSRDGVYARLAKDFPNLPDPQAMFDIHFFRSDPRPFFKFAKEIYPGQFQPSPCHHFIRLLEEKEKLLRNYTQNIDTLEQVAGIQRIVQCHGSFATATCAVCGHKVGSDAIKEDIFNQVIPQCPRCSPANVNAVMKPDIVFFGESLPEHFHNQMAADKDECDLLIVIGSSLKVRPVALIPNSLPAHVPQVLINRERLHHFNFDVELLGNCDGIIAELCRRLGPGWDHLAPPGPPLNEVSLSSLPSPPVSPESQESKSPSCHSDDSAPGCTSPAEQADMLESLSNKDLPSAIDSSECQMSKVTDPHIHIRDDDVGVYEVSTSQPDVSCTKSHNHKHANKWPFSSRNSLTLTDCVPSTSVNEQSCSDTPALDKQSNNACTSQEIETIVNACHRRDVMYIPNTKSHSHHGSSHHVHEQLKSHQHSPSDDLVFAQHEHPSSHEKSSHGHPPHDQSETVKKCEKRPHSSLGVEDSDAQDKACSDIKRHKQSLEEVEEVSQEADKKESDSLSHEESLDEMRKMWQSKHRLSLAHRISEGQVLFMPPSRYVFKGAEVYTDSESSDSSEDDDEEEDDDDDESSVCSDEDAPEDNPADPTLTALADSSAVLPTASDLSHIVEQLPVMSSDCISTSIDAVIPAQVLADVLPSGLDVVTSSNKDDNPLNQCLTFSNIPKEILASCPVSSTDEVLHLDK